MTYSFLYLLSLSLEQLEILLVFGLFVFPHSFFWLLFKLTFKFWPWRFLTPYFCKYQGLRISIVNFWLSTGHLLPVLYHLKITLKVRHIIMLRKACVCLNQTGQNHSVSSPILSFHHQSKYFWTHTMCQIFCQVP